VKRYIKYLLFVLFVSVIINVDAKVKCNDGKPGDTVNCVINNAGRGGKISNIEVSTGLTFVSCDVCNENSYKIEPNKDANFKFKISKDITESKTLTATFGGEDAKIKVIVESQDDNEEDTENTSTIYSVTLIPGAGQSNKTLTCTVNSLNTTCNVTLDELENEKFNGWGDNKDCTEGARGSVKVNKNVTYYACYKKDDVVDVPNEENDKSLLLKSLIVTNGTEKVNLGFSIRKFEYDITIPTEVETLNVEATAQSDNINVEIIGNNELKNEENVIKIVLSTEDGKSNEYIINVKKNDAANNPLLSSLIVGGYNIGFNPEKYEYNLTIDEGIKSLNITATPEKENYEYKIEGNNNLKDGSKISIIVNNTDTDKSSTYIINISKENNNLSMNLGIGGIILIILIILLIVVVKKGKKSNKNNQNNKKSNVSNLFKQQGQVVNNKGNIPEVKPVIPTAPTNSSVVKEVDKTEQVETLDL